MPALACSVLSVSCLEMTGMRRVTARVNDFQVENLAKCCESSCLFEAVVLKADTRGRMSGSVLRSTRSYVLSEMLGSGLERNLGPLSQLVCFSWPAGTEHVA